MGITLEDIVEEILGEIQDEHDDEEELIAQAQQKLRRMQVMFQVFFYVILIQIMNEIPLNDNYSTLAGFILDMLGKTSQKWSNYCLGRLFF